MTSVLKKVSTVTDKGQTTVPKSVREALGVSAGDRIAFYVDRDRRVTLAREDGDAEDPVIGGFLDFLERDMASNPGGSIREIPAVLKARIFAVTGSTTVDPDAPIDGEVDL